MSRLLHRLVLGGDAVNELLFDLECANQQPPIDSAGAHVFIAGLARSGTTVLLQQLFETGEFCSLTYRDMPFVMAPNTWARLAGRFARQTEATQRAHGDGLLVDFDSPEALEEVFWRVHCREQYLRPDCLLAMRAEARVLEAFRRYVGLILRRYDRRRYLSKNNNNLLRLPSLRAAFPQALILVPFRQPLQQAASLQAQHRHFVARHRVDRFSRDYMRWLVHHEFGAEQRPFLAPDEAGLEGPESLNYWLRLWLRVYGHLLEQARATDTRLFCYETFCEQPAEVWGWVAEQAGLDRNRPEINLRAGRHTALEDYSSALAEEAQALYRRMQAQGPLGGH